MASELLQKLGKRRSEVDADGETFESTPTASPLKSDMNGSPKKTFFPNQGDVNETASREFKDKMNRRRLMSDTDGHCFENQPAVRVEEVDEGRAVWECAHDGQSGAQLRNQCNVFENSPSSKVHSNVHEEVHEEDTTATSDSDAEEPMSIMDPPAIISPRALGALLLHGEAKDGEGVLSRLKGEIGRRAKEAWREIAYTQTTDVAPYLVEAERTIIRKQHRIAGEPAEMEGGTAQISPRIQSACLSPRAYSVLLHAGRALDGEGIVARLEDLIQRRSTKLQRRAGDEFEGKNHWLEAERSIIRVTRTGQ